MFIWIEVLRDLWRNKGRSLLILSFGLFMLSSMVLYVGNIQNNEIMLRQLSETIPVTVQVVGENGNQQAGLEIDQAYVDALLSGGVRDPHYTIVAGGNIDAKNQGQPIKFCDTSIVGINKSDSLSPVIREQTDFMQGWGDSFFSDDSAACIINANYALRHQISLGDTIEFPLYIWEYEEDNVHFRFIEVGNVSLLVVGTYTAGADIAGSDTGDVIVPIHWLQNYLSDSGIVYFYSSFQGTLADPLRLNDWKTQMKEVGFQEVDPESFREREGNALRVNDQLFIDTAEEIQENIRIYNGFQLPFFTLLTILVAFVLFLVLRNSRREMAIARSLGRPVWLCGLRHLLGNTILMILACVVSLPVLLLATNLGIVDLLVIDALFLTCAFLGTVIALVFLFHGNALNLLTKVD